MSLDFSLLIYKINVDKVVFMVHLSPKCWFIIHGLSVFYNNNFFLIKRPLSEQTLYLCWHSQNNLQWAVHSQCEKSVYTQMSCKTSILLVVEATWGLNHNKILLNFCMKHYFLFILTYSLHYWHKNYLYPRELRRFWYLVFTFKSCPIWQVPCVLVYLTLACV